MSRKLRLAARDDVDAAVASAVSRTGAAAAGRWRGWALRVGPAAGERSGEAAARMT